jgi:V/A-type H+-transporting ATPase subunit D
MAKKVRLTRPELKRQRDVLTRFERYLPMLKLKQQQLQMTIRDVKVRLAKLTSAMEDAARKFDPYRGVLADRAGVDVESLARLTEVFTTRTNVAGVSIPVFKDATFPRSDYSLFATPAWVDKAIADLKEINRLSAEWEVVGEQFRLLDRELTKIMQRVNLFEKVKIPECREVIRVIRIKLGDDMTAAVGRGKIAKAKIAERSVDFDSIASDARLVAAEGAEG